jgi:hypothetical protein
MYSCVSDISDERNSESCCAAILKAGRWITETGGREDGDCLNIAEGNKLDAVSLASPNPNPGT